MPPREQEGADDHEGDESQLEWYVSLSANKCDRLLLVQRSYWSFTDTFQGTFQSLCRSERSGRFAK
jgi:hypothetical protein